jgi:ribosome-associated translation inhibitor RaiA
MQIVVRSRHVPASSAFRSYCERRLLFALGRFRHRLARVSLTLVDVNGPRGGLDKLCRLVVDLEAGRSVVIESLDTDAYAAADRASQRASYVVARELDRERRYAVGA